MLYKLVTQFVAKTLEKSWEVQIMSKKEMSAHDMNDILPLIDDYIARYEINVSEMCKEIGIPRSTFYDFLYSDSNKSLIRIQTILSYLGLEVSIKPAAEK